MESISAFDIIKVGIGPSSSHTMGPWKAANQFLALLEEQRTLNKVVEIHTHLFGSLAKTGIGHGSDIAIIMGLAGENFQTIDTDLILSKIESINQSQAINISEFHSIPFIQKQHLIFEYDLSLDFHPNGIRFIASLENGSKVVREYFSVGGGFVVCREEEKQVQHNITTQYPCHTAKEILENCNRLNLTISELVLLNEGAWRSEAQTRAHALYIWDEIKQCVFRGINKSGILPGGLQVRRRAYDMNKRLCNGKKYTEVDQWIEAIKSCQQDFSTVNKGVSVFALAVNEENSSIGLMITSPTSGPPGVIPAG